VEISKGLSSDRTQSPLPAAPRNCSRLGLHWSRGGGTLPFTQGVWSSTMLMVMLGCQWEITSTGP
jgi:hypothetical protein